MRHPTPSPSFPFLCPHATSHSFPFVALILPLLVPPAGALQAELRRMASTSRRLVSTRCRRNSSPPPFPMDRAASTASWTLALRAQAPPPRPDGARRSQQARSTEVRQRRREGGGRAVSKRECRHWRVRAGGGCMAGGGFGSCAWEGMQGTREGMASCFRSLEIKRAEGSC